MLATTLIAVKLMQPVDILELLGHDLRLACAHAVLPHVIDQKNAAVAPTVVGSLAVPVDVGGMP